MGESLGSWNRSGQIDISAAASPGVLGGCDCGETAQLVTFGSLRLTMACLQPFLSFLTHNAGRFCSDDCCRPGLQGRSWNFLCRGTDVTSQSLRGKDWFHARGLSGNRAASLQQWENLDS